MERKSTLRNIALVGVGIVALFFAFAGISMLPSSLTASPEVKKYAENTLVELDGESLVATIDQGAGSPNLLFMYASWCPYCKKQFVMLKALKARFGDDLHITYVSVDKDAYDLSRFMMDTYPKQPFTPYHAAPKNRESFDAALQRYGFAPSGSIPHLILFDAKGKSVREFKGLTPIPQLLESIKPLMAETSAAP